jgi:hypothetical protein
MSRDSQGTLPGAEHTIFRGYGPFVALVAVVLAMALLAPTIAPERDVTTRPHPAPAAVDQRSAESGRPPSGAERGSR